MFQVAINRLLYPNGPMVSAQQLLNGEVPPAALHTRHIAVVSADELVSHVVGNTGALFTAIEMMESAGWEVVSIAGDQLLTYAYLRHPSRPPGHSTPGPSHAAG